jgi:hypothetical protein
VILAVFDLSPALSRVVAQVTEAIGAVAIAGGFILGMFVVLNVLRRMVEQ